MAVAIFRVVLLLTIIASINGARMQRKHYKDSDLVVGLPGQPSTDFRHYTGYVSIDKYKTRVFINFSWCTQGDWPLPP
ncbi:hypothetical protein Cni_G29269 [Canna indica]|uniref:Uncharacterized protein n=1 Tax=Canna indica TaxID=4628 RepID=A0AAQ3L4J4_9LILI|nr:hypothetical protein Cni_G29269 [Canna indica]